MMRLQKILSLSNRISDRLKISPLIKRFSSGVFWIMTGNIALRILSGVGTILLARILGPQGLGELGIVQSTVQIFAVYGAFRLGNTAVRYVARYRVENPEKASRVLKLALTSSLFLCVVMGTAVVLSSKSIAIHMLKEADVAGSIAIGGALLFFLTYGRIAQQALAGFEDFRSIARLQVWRGFLALLFPLPFAYFWGVRGALWGLVLSAAILIPVISRYLRSNSTKAGFGSRTSLSAALKELPILWRYSLPGLLVLFILSSVRWVSNVILARIPSGFVELGIFQGAHSWERLIAFIPGNMVRVILPILSETHGKRYVSEFRKAVSLQLEAVWLFTVPIGIVMVGFARPLASVFGKRFLGIEQVLPFLAISAVLFSVNEGIRVIYEGMARQWMNVIMYLAWGGALVTACILLVPRKGAAGLAISHLIASAVLLLVQSVYVNKKLVPGIVKRAKWIFISYFVLLGSCFLVRYFLPSSLTGFAYIFLFACSLFPILRRLRAKKKQLFDKT